MISKAKQTHSLFPTELMEVVEVLLLLRRKNEEKYPVLRVSTRAVLPAPECPRNLTLMRGMEAGLGMSCWMYSSRCCSCERDKG